MKMKIKSQNSLQKRIKMKTRIKRDLLLRDSMRKKAKRTKTTNSKSIRTLKSR